MNQTEIIEKIAEAEWKKLDERTKSLSENPASGATYSGHISTIEYLLEAVPQAKGQQQVAAYVTNTIHVPLHKDNEKPNVEDYVDVDYRGVCGNETLRGLLRDRIKKEFNGKHLRAERVI